MPISALMGGVVAAYTGTVIMMAVWALLAVLAALPVAKSSALDEF